MSELGRAAGSDPFGPGTQITPSPEAGASQSPTSRPSRPTTSRVLTQAELVAEMTQRFGPDTWRWAFQCPRCSDIACAADFRAAGAKPHRVGQECVGRYLGALDGPPTRDTGMARAARGCDWVAYGLPRGPWFVVMPDGSEAPIFPIAPPPPGKER